MISKHSSGCHMATEEDNHQSRLGKEMWTAGYKNSLRKMEAEAQQRAEDGGQTESVAYAPPSVTSQVYVKFK